MPFFDDMINITNLDPNKIQGDKKSYKNILNLLQWIPDS